MAIKYFFRSLRLIRKMWPVLFLTITLITMIGCGSDSESDGSESGGSGPPAGQLSGVFVDSPVSGLKYASPNSSGTTEANGAFNYFQDDEITFAIGDLILGSAAGQETLTPLDLISEAANATDQRVTNILVLLQTLDQDGDLNNGIQITPEISAIVSDYSSDIDFDQSATAFAADTNVSNLLADLNAADVFTSYDIRDRVLQSEKEAQSHFTRTMSERIIVDTSYGKISGYSANDTTWQFIGIPYAQPPVGELRWKPPVAPTVWSGVRDAVDFGNVSPQSAATEVRGGMSENCLYLNVTTPKTASDLPVMVWFHGGGFVNYSANQWDFNNAGAMTTKGVIVVTVTHRLGPFGYLAHPLLMAESGTTGNYGQLDLIAALTWVKDNIVNFGGDPNNVTIFGQSGGGGKVQSLMTSSLATGLFHKAICISGTAEQTMTNLNGLDLTDAYAVGEDLFSRLGVTTLAQVRDLPWTTIIDAELAEYPVALGTAAVYGPVVDSYYVTANVKDSITGGLQNDVPFIAGATSADLEGIVPGLVEQMPWRSTYNTADQYVYKWSKVSEGWEAKGILPGHTADLAYVFNYPATMINYYLAGYIIDPNTGLPPVIGDHNNNGVTGSDGDPLDIFIDAGWSATTDDAVVDTVMTMYANFAKIGNPSTSTFAWPAYTVGNDTYIDIDSTCTVHTDLSAGW